jgi:hypothetical protein
MRIHPYTISLSLAVAIVTLLAVACGDTHQSPTASSPVSAAGGGAAGARATAVKSDKGGAVEETASTAGANTSAVCHLEGNGTYHLLQINPNALQAHLNHGDVLPKNGACPGPVTTTVGR